ncbi:MAG: efflux RND transporter permease subunit [Phycisphaerales bacterium]|nr:efflux RND transporter permease subunit [Phycisphaerales bacterium]
MVRFFIHRPIFASVIAIITALAGAIAMVVLPIAQFPNIVPPTVQVSSTYNGADAVTVANSVTMPLEAQINGAEGMIYMSSNSTSTGASVITVTFEVGYDLDIGAVDVLNRTQTAMAQLPQQVQQLGVSITKQSTNLTVVVSLLSPDGTYDSKFLSNYANIVVQPILSRVEGVGDINVFGLLEYSMRVWLEPDSMAAMGISTDEVTQAIQIQNQQAAIGSIGASPTVGATAFNITLTTQGRLSTAEEFGNIVVRTGEDGAVVRIRDIGRTELGAFQYGSTSTMNGLSTGTIGVYQLPTANAFGVVEAVKEQMERLQPMFPPGVTWQVTYDSTAFVSASVDDLVTTLVEAGLLVLAVIFIFLQSWRATLIPMIAIPVSIVGTFAIMLAFGFTINTLTLLGLVLAIGLVVDDSIIVVENVYRQLELGAPDGKTAAERAMKEVAGPIVATSSVLLAVFIPAALMPGITGQLYNQFALTIAFSIVLSMVNSLTLSPALCGVFLQKTHKTTFRPYVLFNEAFETCTGHYSRFVRYLAHRWYIIAATFVAGAIGVVIMFDHTPTAFIPNEDQGYYFVGFQLPSGSSLERTEAVSARVLEIVKADPAVVDVIQINGFNFLTAVGEVNSGFIIVTLKPWDERDARTENSRAIIVRAFPKLMAIPEANVFPFPPPPIPGLGAVGGWQLQLEDINGAGFPVLAQASADFMAALAKRPEVVNLSTPFQSQVPIIRLKIDRAKAMSYGLSMTDVFNTLGQTIGQSFVNNFNEFNQVYNVMIQAEAEDRMKLADIFRLYVRNASGGMVPISAFTTYSFEVGTNNATRYNMYNTVQINGSTGPGFGSGQSIAAVAEVAAATLPTGITYEWTGVTFQQIEAGTYAPFIFALALIAVFLLLAALYESWLLPLNVLLAVTFAVLGALLLLKLLGRNLDVYGQIGLVMLVGLAAKNAILIVEFAKMRHDGGEGIIDAAVNASHQRLRPIMMTAIAFMLGVVPLTIAVGAGAQSRRSIGTTVLGGMIGSSTMDQLVVPVFFVMIMSISVGFKNWIGKSKKPAAPTH